MLHQDQDNFIHQKNYFVGGTKALLIQQNYLVSIELNKILLYQKIYCYNKIYVIHETKLLEIYSNYEKMPGRV